ncbi:unnamed protein product [Ectocarpus sp. CCAP 1310/34]|nr:unnamed protein product [Ectocarpus sp. CCAP 1310/34]
MLSGLTKAPEFKLIREMHYRDNFTSVDSLQATANRFFVDQQSRNASGPVVSGRGAAMAVASDTDQCRRCKSYGHFQRDCPQQVQKSRPKQSKKKGANKGGGGASVQPKRCSYRNTKTHSDAECLKQKEIRENKQKELEGLAANLALLQPASHANFLQLSNNGSAHLAQSSPAVAQQAPSEPTSGGTGICLINVECAGPPTAFRVLRAGTNLFSVTLAMLKGVETLFHPDNPRLESGDVVFPMQTLGVDATTGKRIYSIEVKLGGEPGGPTVLGDAPDALALKVESADLWHRRMGHINGKSLDVLRKEPVNGVDYTGNVNDCCVCPLGKSAQQPHPKQVTYGVLRPFQHVSVDTLGPFTPTALGGFKYATKFVDQQTKWAEIVLMKDQACSVDSLALFKKGTVVPTGERIHCLRGDPGTEFTSAEFRQYCQDIGIKLEFASPNTPQQMGANERAGRTVLNVVRCLLADSTLPNFLWGELIQTAVYLSNRVPHAALQNGTPYKALYGKDAYLGHLRVIGSRAFVHEETHTRKLEHRAWEGRLVVGWASTTGSSRTTTTMTWSSSRMPNAKTIRELRRTSYAFTAKGEFPEVAHRDGSFGFTEYAYATGASQPDVPQTIEEARAMSDGEQWNAAAEREIANMKERQVYKLVPRTAVPPGRKRIKSKWVFKPVQFNLELDQMDLSTAFLYADILENVFVEQPPGFEVKDKDGGDLVMQLQKSLYGLAQSPSNWFHTIDPFLVEIGFVPLKSDTCVYLYDHDDVQVYLTLYVDDLLLAGNNSNAISMIKKKLKQRFKMTDMGEVKLVLGMEIKRDRNQGALTISQEAYTKSILERFGMSECKPTSTPGYGVFHS